MLLNLLFSVRCLVDYCWFFRYFVHSVVCLWTSDYLFGIFKLFSHSKILEKKNIDSYRKAGKIYVSNFGKIIQTIFSLLDLIVLFFTKPRKHEKENEYKLINEDIGLNERI